MLCCVCSDSRKCVDEPPSEAKPRETRSPAVSSSAPHTINRKPSPVSWWRCCSRRPVSARTQLLRQDEDTASSAAAKWAIQKPDAINADEENFGRYKYCGLRPDPFVGEPPTYSWVPVDIPLPELEPDESKQLGMLAAKVAYLTAAGVRTDPPTLLRNLRFHGGSVELAEESMRQALEWRLENDVQNALTCWDLELYEQTLRPWWPSGGILGVGLGGEPVVIERLGRCRWADISASVPFEQLMKLDIVHCLRLLGACEEDAVRRRVPFLGITLIVDLEGMSWASMKMQSLKVMGRIFGCRSNIIPGTLLRAVIVNAPAVFVKAWPVIKHVLLYPRTAALIDVAGYRDSLTLLRRYADDNVIPAYLGGSRCIDGDPECRILIAPGGRPPDDALRRLQF